jgi:hypothetical protein
MTAGMAVASFFVGAGVALAMSVMYDFVERKSGSMTGAYRFGANAVVLIAFIVPSIPGSHYRSEHPGASFLGVGLLAWEIIAVVTLIVASSVCSAVVRGGTLMDEINAQSSDSEGGEQ